MSCECGVYDQDFILDLRNQVLNKLAYVTNRDIADIKYNLGIECDVLDYQLLNTYACILEKLSECNTCFQYEEIEVVISQIKNRIDII